MERRRRVLLLENGNNGFGVHDVFTGWEASGGNCVGAGGRGVGLEAGLLDVDVESRRGEVLVFECVCYVWVFDPLCFIIYFLVVERETDWAC
jgi:hypothetical protein